MRDASYAPRRAGVGWGLHACYVPLPQPTVMDELLVSDVRDVFEQ